MTELPKLLGTKLLDVLKDCKSDDDEVKKTTQVLIDTFVKLDESCPADPSGGCTASVVLKQGKKVYVANAGDSRSMVVAFRPSTSECDIIYISREDKPSLPDEKARVQKAGGQVYIPVRGTSRVVYNDPITGAPTGLAMSRSIGDRAAGKIGVIPDPIVKVLDIDEIVSEKLEPVDDRYQMDENGDMSNPSAEESESDDVHIFVVSATDGMMDYLDEEAIVSVLAHSLYDENGSHPISACEHLIYSAAQAWQQAKQGRYRDDIAIAVSVLRTPPSADSRRSRL